MVSSLIPSTTPPRQEKTASRAVGTHTPNTAPPLLKTKATLCPHGCGITVSLSPHSPIIPSRLAGEPPTKQQLVRWLKDAQRRNERCRKQWSIYCHKYSGSVKDLGRHHPSSLLYFLLVQMRLGKVFSRGSGMDPYYPGAAPAHPPAWLQLGPSTLAASDPGKSGTKGNPRGPKGGKKSIAKI